MDNLITLYKQRLDLQNATFSRIEHDDALVAIVYKITQPSGQQLILKICERDNDYLREVYFLNYFADKLPVPRILQVMPPQEGMSDAILMEYIPGTLLTAAELTNDLAYEIGSQLARIHLERTAGYGELIQPDNLSSDPRTYFAQKFEEGFAECSNNLPKELLDRCRHYFDTHIDLLDLADGPCIVHRDFRPGNLIVRDGKLQGIIDWSAGRASFAQEDFCSMEHTVWSTDPRIQTPWPTDPRSKKPFLAGYASVRPVPDYQAMMPLLRLSRAFATIGFTVKRGTWDGIHARVYQFNRRFLETFF
jgi:Ser/Thr protein kinase RdoA (MazF antagonist)